ncbi:MAG: hypothetical protein HYV28_08775 [Ignavibacteriales bacterium]|nr:hypothetical protein [Ignavibacteriales bacterium]
MRCPPLTKMKNILSFLQQNIKIINDYNERDFSDILSKKIANPYELCGLAYYMLKKCDIKTEYLLIHSASNGYFDPKYISVHQFDVPALKINMGQDTYVIFPHLKYMPVGQIPEEMNNETALMISNDALTNGKFWTIPDLHNSTDSTDTKINLNIDENGKILVKEIKSYHGIPAYTNRVLFSDSKMEETEKIIRKNFLSQDISISSLHYDIKNLTDLDKDFIIELNYNVDDLVTITPEEVIFQTGGLLSPVNLYSQKVDTVERINPIKIKSREIFTKETSITFPGNWKIQTQLKDTIIENKFGSNIEHSSSIPNGVNIKQTTQLLKSEGEKNQISLLYNLIYGSYKMNMSAIVFDKQK